MNTKLARWNGLDEETAAAEILPCCGSTAWARGVAALRPLETMEALSVTSDTVWAGLAREDWIEAFASHPRIGQTHAKATAQSLAWSAREQGTPDEIAKAKLAVGNARYEERFGRIFIVCATGKTSMEMLAILEGRLKNDDETEMLEAAEQQRLITQIRLRKWLEQENG
ncbi:2-oxo-4-hydroxy-4-carboxy-5-ureidoimidazoline decarboxylase [Granulicella pectinivorans]|nr:2-oxo-4-hydroxy-4-carboxy-5-ureidoimidazoline decarboxylase [Granulicella pectinivorans]